MNTFLRQAFFNFNKFEAEGRNRALFKGALTSWNAGELRTVQSKPRQMSILKSFPSEGSAVYHLALLSMSKNHTVAFNIRGGWKLVAVLARARIFLSFVVQLGVHTQTVSVHHGPSGWVAPDLQDSDFPLLPTAFFRDVQLPVLPTATAIEERCNVC